MLSKKNKIYRFLPLIFLLSTYIYFSLKFLPYYQYQVNSDEISYITIALKYLHGNYYEALNGYWGPLLSWIIAPFLGMHLKPLFAAKVASLLIGALTLTATYLFSKTVKMNDYIRYVILVLLIPIIIWYAFAMTTPDLLVSGFLILYFYSIFRKNYKKKHIYGFSAGTLGGLAFLAKHFAGFFFLFHFLVMNIIYYFYEKNRSYRNNILKNTFFGFCTFLLISGIWILLISNKYGRLTISSSSTFNRATVGPFSQGAPIFSEGLIPPPNSTAVDSWEDPTFYINYFPSKMRNWSPFESKALFRYQVNIVVSNIKILFNTLEVHNSFMLWLIILLITISIKDFLKYKFNNIYLLYLLTILLYIFGYSTVFIIERYLLPIIIFSLVISGNIINNIFVNFKLNTIQKILFLALFFTLLTFKPSNLLNESKYLERGKQDLYLLLKNKVKTNARTATNTKFEETEVLSFYLKDQFYGQTININSKTILEDLEKYNIDYYFVWGNYVNPDIKLNTSFLSKYKEISGNRIPDLRIYAIKEKD